MIHYGKTIKVLKWIFQKRREESSKHTGKGEIISDECETARIDTINDLEDIEEDNDEEIDRRIVVGKSQERGIAGLGVPLNNLKEMMKKRGASFNFNLKQLKGMQGCVPECFGPSFQQSLFVKRAEQDFIPLLGDGHQKVTSTALDNIRRRARKFVGNKKIESLKDTTEDENPKKKESRKNNNSVVRATCRMKEIVKWQGAAAKISSESNKRWKILNRNKGSLNGTSRMEEDLLSCSSKLSSRSSGLSSSFSSSSGSSSSSSSSSSSCRGFQSRLEMQVATRLSKDNWITSDSEYVVLEI